MLMLLCPAWRPAERRYLA